MTAVSGESNFTAVDSLVGVQIDIVLVAVASGTFVKGSLALVGYVAVAVDFKPRGRSLVGIALQNMGWSYIRISIWSTLKKYIRNYSKYARVKGKLTSPPTPIAVTVPDRISINMESHL